jgi:hypothetical protein
MKDHASAPAVILVALFSGFLGLLALQILWIVGSLVLGVAHD